jgi:predicted secreted protein
MDNLRMYAQAGQKIKRFSFVRNGNLVSSKPNNNETFVIMEDFLGDRSILWVACYGNGKELWRHNVNDIVRLTYE